MAPSEEEPFINRDDLAYAGRIHKQIIEDQSKESKKQIKEEYLCKSSFDFEFDHILPKNRRSLYDTDKKLPCQEHAANTCCTLHDARKIGFHLSKYQFENEKCKQMTEKVHCSVCDGDMGLQRKTGICLEFCRDWWSECQDESAFQIKPEDVTVSKNSNETQVSFYRTLDFVKEGQEPKGEVRKVRDFPLFSNDAEKFCNAMGFEVNYPSESNVECFNGNPLASTFELNRSHLEQRWVHSKQRPRSKRAIKKSVYESVQILF